MPIRINNDLPAKKILEDENIFVMDMNRAMTQDIRPLKIVIMNLMPIKQDTELDLLRSLSNTPLQVDVTFLRTKSHQSKNTSVTHLDTFYLDNILIRIQLDIITKSDNRHHRAQLQSNLSSNHYDTIQQVTALIYVSKRNDTITKFQFNWINL